MARNDSSSKRGLKQLSARELESRYVTSYLPGNEGDAWRGGAHYSEKNWENDHRFTAHLLKGGK